MPISIWPTTPSAAATCSAPPPSRPPTTKASPPSACPTSAPGGVGLICATIFCDAVARRKRGYRNADEAHAMATDQLDWYRKQADDGPDQSRDRNASRGRASPRASARTADAQPRRSCCSKAPIRFARPTTSPHWFDAGLRIVGLAWKRTRYAGGTGAPGPAHAEGVALVKRTRPRRHHPRRLAPGRGIVLATARPQRRPGDGVALQLPRDRPDRPPTLRRHDPRHRRTRRRDRHQLLRQVPRSRPTSTANAARRSPTSSHTSSTCAT